MDSKSVLIAVVMVASACAHAPVNIPQPGDPAVAVEPPEPVPPSPVVLKLREYPNDCDDQNPLTPDDTTIDGLCVGIVDADRDGAPNYGAGPLCVGPNSPEDCVDNCPYVPNPNQADTDGDGMGDACEVVMEWDHVETDVKVVALTFDDGYNDSKLNAILTALNAHGARSTFFLNGLYISDNTLKPETLQRIADGGHLCGNHTFHHKLGKGPGETEAEIRDCEPLFLDLAGIELKPLFRSPAYARRLWRDVVLLKNGYNIHLKASLDTQDWTNPPPPPDKIVECVAAEVEPGDIILFHVGPNSTPIAIPLILENLAEQGYYFVTAADLVYFGQPATVENDTAKSCTPYYSK